MKKLRPVNILMADDDPDDRMLMKQALEANNLVNTIHFVEDGEELMHYLYKSGKFTTAPTFRPGLILLDLNRPKVDERSFKTYKIGPRSKAFQSLFCRHQGWNRI